MRLKAWVSSVDKGRDKEEEYGKHDSHQRVVASHPSSDLFMF
jgi:hypothetical protein